MIVEVTILRVNGDRFSLRAHLSTGESRLSLCSTGRPKLMTRPHG